MPFCSRIINFRLQSDSTYWVVYLSTPLNPSRVDFTPIVNNALPKASFDYEHLVTGDYNWNSRFSIPKAEICYTDLREFLRILKWTVTIADDADESHALSLHQVPQPTQNDNEPELGRTPIGSLVHKAKSYGARTGDEEAAFDLSTRIARWIIDHPRYCKADVIMPTPPGNPRKTFDLPKYMATRLKSLFGYLLGSCEITSGIEQQKHLDDPDSLKANVHGKFRVSTKLNGQSVIILDDIYRSGETLRELTRACRDAGAQSVLSLTVTKTARFCNGVPPSDWYEVSVEGQHYYGR